MSAEANDKVKLQFSISDLPNGRNSGLNEVTYTINGSPDLFSKTLTSFELDRAFLDGKSSIEVSISATDNVGNKSNEKVVVDLSSPTLNLSFDDKLYPSIIISMLCKVFACLNSFKYST